MLCIKYVLTNMNLTIMKLIKVYLKQKVYILLLCYTQFTKVYLIIVLLIMCLKK